MSAHSGPQPHGGSTSRAPRLRFIRSRLWVVFVLLGVVACAGEFTTQSEPLRLLADRLPDAVLNEPYAETVQAVGGLRPYSFALESGSLPPGLTLEGGSVRGRATVEGAYEFTISVSDANLSSTFETFTLQVITPPPPRLTLQPPDTEVRGAVTLRARVTDARSLAGLRTEIRWDPAQFTLVEESITASRQDVTLFHDATPGRVQVDVAVLGETLDGAAQVFTLSLAPVAPPVLLAVSNRTEFASRRSGELLFDHQAGTEGPGTLGGEQEAVEDVGANEPEDAPDQEDDDGAGESDEGQDETEPGGESDAP